LLCLENYKVVLLRYL